MCFLIPVEISALLTSFVCGLLGGDVVIVCGNRCNGARGCCAKSGIAGVKDNVTDTAMISCVFIGLDAEGTLIGTRWRFYRAVHAVGKRNSYFSVDGLGQEDHDSCFIPYHAAKDRRNSRCCISTT